MSWSRRIGVAAAMVLLVGGSIAFAGVALGPQSGKPAPSAPPPPAPTLLATAARLTRDESIDVTVNRPDGLRRDQEYLIRVYVNGELVRERPLPATEHFGLGEIPLERGENEIRVALVGTGGEGQRSAAVAVTRDDVAPVIRVSRPQGGDTIYSAQVELIGRTEPGADMRVVGRRGGERFETSVQPDGRFESALRLSLGQNTLTLRSQDAAGNVARTRIVLVRAESAASLSLTVSPTEIDATLLPVQLQLVATVRDELGRPVDGAQVTFGLSPPNRATTTYRTTSDDGRAIWAGIDVPAAADVSGTWLATVLAILPSGAELRDDESISVQ